METVLNVNGKLCRCFLFSPLARKPRPRVEKTFFTKAIEGFYDNCAAYNMRYVPYRTVTDQVSLKTVAKDVVVLSCFMATSLVVLLTILCRIAMHLGRLCQDTEQWVEKKIRLHLENRQKYRLQEQQAPNVVETIVTEDELQDSFKEDSSCDFCRKEKERIETLHLENRQRDRPQEQQAPNVVETIVTEDELQNSFKEDSSCDFCRKEKERIET